MVNYIDRPLRVQHYKPYRNQGCKIIVWHIQEGRNFGSWEWFHVVKASCTVMIARNGDVWRVVPENCAPWTNGDVQSPRPAMVAVMNKYGWDPNDYSLTIEFEGYASTPNGMGWPVGFTTAQFESAKEVTADWQSRYNIPDDMVFRHADINSVTRPNCIPHAMWAQGRAWIDGTPMDTSYKYAKPIPVPGFNGTRDVVIDGTRFVADKRTVKISANKANVRQYATRSSPLTRKALVVNDKVDVLGSVEGEDVEDNRMWWITESYSRIWSGATDEKPDPLFTSLPDASNGGPVLFEGKVYYRMGEFGEQWADGRKARVVSRANLREEANLTSKVLGVAEVGKEITIKYFTDGDVVKEKTFGSFFTTRGDRYNTAHVYGQVQPMQSSDKKDRDSTIRESVVQETEEQENDRRLQEDVDEAQRLVDEAQARLAYVVHIYEEQVSEATKRHVDSLIIYNEQLATAAVDIKNFIKDRKLHEPPLAVRVVNGV